MGSQAALREVRRLSLLSGKADVFASKQRATASAGSRQAVCFETCGASAVPKLRSQRQADLGVINKGTFIGSTATFLSPLAQSRLCLPGVERGVHVLATLGRSENFNAVMERVHTREGIKNSLQALSNTSKAPLKVTFLEGNSWHWLLAGELRSVLLRTHR